VRLLEIAQVPSEHVEDFKSGMYRTLINIQLSLTPPLSPQVQDLQHEQHLGQPERCLSTCYKCYSLISEKCILVSDEEDHGNRVHGFGDYRQP
jgi:hypothetical protein